MRLTFEAGPTPKYPHGYWYAETADGGYDADGAMPLDAVANLARVLEAALYEERRAK